MFKHGFMAIFDKHGYEFFCTFSIWGNQIFGFIADTADLLNHLQFFIMRHRDEVRTVNSDRPMTFHGLRHTYAAEKYQELVNSGKSPLDAHFEVSRLLGHERPDVTNIYLAPVRKGDTHGK